MSTRIFIPGDSGAVALGADRLAARMAEALKARGSDARIVRNGSRGLYWLEPMVEVETEAGRVAYGPVKTSDIDSLLDAGFLDGGDHPLSLGLTEDIPFLKRQTRLTFARCGITDPLSLEDYRGHGGLAGLTKAVEMAPAVRLTVENYAIEQMGLLVDQGTAFTADQFSDMVDDNRVTIEGALNDLAKNKKLSENPSLFLF